MKEINLLEPAIFFLCSIGLFVHAYLSFKGKLSQRWRSGYFYAPKDEREQANFTLISKIQAILCTLGGIIAILFGCKLLLQEKWIESALIILGLIILGYIIIACIVLGSRGDKKHEKSIHSSHKTSSLAEIEKGQENFSITEIRINALRFPIIFGCYVLLPLIMFVFILVFIAQIPPEYFNLKDAVPLLIFSFILGPVCWILNKLLPKMTFSYKDGIFTKEKNGKTDTFSLEEVSKIKTESPVMPDFIHFYLKNNKKPIKVSMLGFKQDDRFEIPRKVMSLTKMRLTKAEKKALDDFSQ